MTSPPSGTVTFLFTDIEGSTRLWEERPDEMRAALAEHDALLRAAIDAHGGYVFSTGGDGFAVAFSRAHDAVDAATKAQAALADHPLIRVRMGIHTGEVQERDGDYFGPAVNRAARIMAVGHGGQVLVSSVTRGLLGAQQGFTDLGDHRLRDLSSVERLHQLGGEAFPRLRTVDLVPGNLPANLMSLLGREDDVNKLVQTVSSSPIVTLTGVGGVGKTRLALRVAAEMAPRYADGAWIVELASVTDPKEVPAAVAATLGITQVAGDRASAVAGHLAECRALVVLDNCEHVIDAVADLVDQISLHVSQSRIVATSREPLGVTGEVVRRVRSLAVPAPGASPIDVALTPAVSLFVERARAVADDFDLTRENADAVAGICSRLDGIPLAIELAAVRVSALSPGEILDRLDERFRILGAGTRRAHERHKTLEAAVWWSFELLSASEQVVFRRLGVFNSSFDLVAAEAVASGDSVRRDGVLDLLSQLVDKSMVQVDRGRTGSRYRLLETLRQFAVDRLGEVDETARARALHAAHFVRVGLELGTAWDMSGDDVARSALEADIDNFRAAVRWLDACGEPDSLLDLARALTLFWAACVRAADIAEWVDAAFQQLPTVETQDVVDALALAAAARTVPGDFARAYAEGERSQRIATNNSLRQHPSSSFAMAMAAWMQHGDLALAEQLMNRGIDAALDRGLPVHLAMLRGVLCNVIGESGRVSEARALARQTIDEAVSSRNKQAVLQGAFSASTALLQLEPPDAPAVIELHDAHFDDADDLLAYAGWVGWCRGLAEMLIGSPAAAVTLRSAADAAQRGGSGHALAFILEAIAMLLAERGRKETAVLLAGKADAFCRELGVVRAVAQARVRRGLDEALSGFDAVSRARLTAQGAAMTARQCLDMIDANWASLESHSS